MIELQLPKGWKRKSLKEVSKTTSGGTPSRKQPEYYNGTIPWVKSGELKYGVIHSTEEYITEDAINNSSAKLFPKGTLLIALYGATVGRMATLGIDAASNQAVCALFPKDELNQKYLYWYLFYRRPELLENRIGGAQPNISQTVLQDLELPIPPLPIQRQIVARIEELFSEVDAGVKELQTALKQLKTYRQAVLHHYLSNKEWERVKLGKVLESICYGTSKKCEYEGGRTPVLRIPNIGLGGQIIIDDLKYADFTKEELVQLELKEGDLLTIRSNGSVSLVGQLGQVTKSVEGYLYAGYLIRLRLDQSQCIPIYIRYMLQSPALRDQIEAKAKSTSGVNNINSKELQSLDIILPDLETQTAIVAEIESKLSEADAMQTAIRESLVKAEALRQSILKQAFEGKLISGVVEDQQESREMGETKVSASATKAHPQQMSLF